MTTAPENPAERVRDRMRRWMDTTQLGQREFADDLKKSQVWLQKILNGENHVRLRDLDDVARALRTTASELVRGDEERYQLELTPTEVRIVEQLRRRPDTLAGIALLLRIPAPTPLALEAPPAAKERRTNADTKSRRNTV